MSYHLFILTGLMSILTGCAQFPVLDEIEGKSHLANNHNEEDFSDDQVSGSDRFLLSELKRLETSQHLEDLELYRDHRSRFKTVSEKIYFLKLSPFDRRDYLVARGFISEREGGTHRTPAQVFKGLNDEVALGMSKPDVLDSLGKPLRVEIAGNPRHENERWLYRFNGAPKYIYFEAGEVQGWE